MMNTCLCGGGDIDPDGYMPPHQPDCEEQMKVKLGNKVRDKITKFEGVATARHEYLNGCVRFTVTAEKTTAEGKEIFNCIDEPQLELVEDTPAPDVKPRGGPHDDPSRPSAPTRFAPEENM